MTLTEKIVQSIFSIQYENISPLAIKTAHFTILDSVGNALAASQTNIGQKIINLSKGEENGSSTIWGSDRSSSLLTSVFVNACLAQLLDFDDTQEINTFAVGHPGPAIIPISLTVGERLKSEGRELLRAIVLGYDVCMRFSLAIEPRDASHFGFSGSQILGAVTAASILSGLNEKETVNAIGLAVSTSSPGNTKGMWSLDERPMSWIKDGVGFVAMIALRCVQLAKEGFVATRRGLDPKDEYYKLCGSLNYKPLKLLDEFGKHFLIEDISFKPYPTCRYIQSTLDAIAKLVEENNLDWEDVAKVQIFTTPFLAHDFDIKEPKTFIDAEFSLPYAVEKVISKVTPSPSWYASSQFEDASFKERVNRIELIGDNSIEELRVEKNILRPRIKMFLCNGEVLSSEGEFARGNPRNPFQRSDHERKFEQNLKSCFFNEKKIQRLKKLILEIGKVQDVGEIASKCKLSELK